MTNWAAPRGEIVQFSLLTRTGHTADFSADHDLSTRGKWFFDGAAAPLLAGLIADLPDLLNFRVAVFEPGAELAAHEEHVPFRTSRGTVGARLRFHLPLRTNDRAEINLDGSVYHLESGVVHLINQGCVHAAQNRGPAARVHLVWDAVLTDRLFRFLFDERDERRPPYLRLATEEAEPRRAEPLGAHRRLPPPVSSSEAWLIASSDLE